MGGAEHKTSRSAFRELGNREEQCCPWDKRNQAPHKLHFLFLVFIVLSLWLLFFHVGCAYPVDRDLSAPGLGVAHSRCQLA